MRCLHQLSSVLLPLSVGAVFVVLLGACGGGSVSSPDGPPGLLFEPALHEVGAVKAESPGVIFLPWRRTGAGELRILGTRLDCGCAAIEALPEELAAGSRGRLRLQLQPRTRPGPFRIQVRIYTTAPPPHDRVLVQVRGHAGAALAFSPALVDLGRRSPGMCLQRQVEVCWGVAPMSGGIESLSATLVGLAGRVRVEPPVGRVLPGCLLELELVTPSTPGSFRACVRLHAGERTLGTVVVRGVVE